MFLSCLRRAPMFTGTFPDVAAHFIRSTCEFRFRAGNLNFKETNFYCIINEQYSLFLFHNSSRVGHEILYHSFLCCAIEDSYPYMEYHLYVIADTPVCKYDD